MAVLYDPAVPTARQVKDDLPVAARAVGLTIQPWEIRVAEDFERVIVAPNQERPEGLYASSSLVIAANGKRIANFAIKSRLPSIYASKQAVDAGGLMYYGADLADSYRRVAYYADFKDVLFACSKMKIGVESRTAAAAKAYEIASLARKQTADFS